MALSFRGVEAWQNFSYGYVCMHCKKEVVKKSSFLERVGEELGHNYEMRVSPAEETAMTNNAKARLLPAINFVTNQWNEIENYSVYLGDNGICPTCGKYQHWSNEVKTFKTEKFTVGDFGAIFGFSFIGGGILMIVFAFILSLFGVSSDTVNTIIVVIFFLSFVGIFILCFNVFKRDKKVISTLISELDSFEKTYPYFIALGEEGHQSVGLKYKY